MIVVPIRTERGQNSREHHFARARRVKAEKEAAAWLLQSQPKPELPCRVILTRIAPSSGLDDDNLAGSLKAIRDSVAAWLGVDDRDRERVRYVYEQRRGPWAVEIGFTPMAKV